MSTLFFCDTMKLFLPDCTFPKGVYMKRLTKELPWNDCLCRRGQETAYLRPYTKDWNTPESDSLHLEYSYNGKNWYAFNGNNGIWFPDFGSHRLASPAVYALEDGGYFVTALDCLDPSRAFFAETKDFIHFTGAGYTDASMDFSRFRKFSAVPDAENRLEVPVSLLETLFPVYGKPEPVLLTAVEEISLTSPVNTPVDLPAKAAVEYSNGSSGMLPVQWDTSAVDTQTPGTYQVSGKLQETVFENPLIRHRADPYIYKHTDGKYYFTASYTDMEHNLDGRYQYLYILLRRADTIEGLADSSDSYEEKIVYQRSPICNGTMSPHIWAPEIHFIHGHWYIYYTTTISDESSWRIRPHCLECLDADPLNGTWTQKGPLVSTVPGDIAFTDFSLDHTYFCHQGRDYILWAQKTNNISDIFIAELSNPWTLCSPAVRLSHPEYNWELHGFPVDEGPGVICHGDRIFVTFSASGTDAMYCVGLLYADQDADLLSASSWTKLPYPVFQSSAATGQYGLGHNSFTKSADDSEDLIIYHGRQEERYLIEEDYQPLYDAGRNASVGKIYWNKDGMPDFSVPAQRIVADDKLLEITAEVVVTEG